MSSSKAIRGSAGSGELDAPSLVTPGAVLERVAEYGDLFADVLAVRQSL